MNRRRTFLIIFIVLIVVLGIGVGALLLLSGGLGGGGQEQPGPIVDEGGQVITPTPEAKERVVVALQTIPRGMRIPLDAIEIREWPVNDLPADPIYTLDEVNGMVARAEIQVWRPISKEKVKSVFQGEGSELSLAVPKGKVLIAVPITAMSAAGNALRPGDSVDVLVSLSMVEVDEDSQIKLPIALSGGEDCLAGCQPTGDQIPRLVTQYTVQKALVLNVGLWQEGQDLEVPVTGPTPTPQILEETTGGEEAAPVAENIAVALTDIRLISLAVSPQDALVLKWLRESNASIDMVMRSAVDTDLYNPEAVTLQYMIDRFGISIPPRLPHSPENEFKYSLIDTALEYQVPPPE
ncbi:MAG: Flp pilus assembly protein CpaB [Anaerolineae bacterium]|nr:Flp pilus assembly protein CpaB [Anaerolineae bacterium]